MCKTWLKSTVCTEPLKHHQSSSARRGVIYVTVCQRKLASPARCVVKHDGAGQCTNSGGPVPRTPASRRAINHQLGGNESASIRAGRTSWQRRHLTSRSPMPTPEREKSRKMRRGGRRSGAPPRSLISLLWASSTLSTSEVKGHTKYISECHLRGERGRERGRRNDRPPRSAHQSGWSRTGRRC